jgi:hypothetical protein
MVKHNLKSQRRQQFENGGSKVSSRLFQFQFLAEHIQP